MGRLGTVDLLIKAACLVIKLYKIIHLKSDWVKLVRTRRSTLLSLPPQLVFPVLGLNKCLTTFLFIKLHSIKVFFVIFYWSKFIELTILAKSIVPTVTLPTFLSIFILANDIFIFNLKNYLLLLGSILPAGKTAKGFSIRFLLLG
jgi:hypothetical protein